MKGKPGVVRKKSAFTSTQLFIRRKIVIQRLLVELCVEIIDFRGRSLLSGVSFSFKAAMSSLRSPGKLSNLIEYYIRVVGQYI